MTVRTLGFQASSKVAKEEGPYGQPSEQDAVSRGGRGMRKGLLTGAREPWVPANSLQLRQRVPRVKPESNDKSGWWKRAAGLWMRTQ